MSSRLTHAHRAMLAIAGYLVTGSIEDENRALMLERLARVLPDCETGPETIAPVRLAARQMIVALNDRDRSHAEIRLMQAVHHFNRAGAGAYLDAWQKQAVAEGRQV
ncbi:hypothetical protein [Leisingera sp. M658]|uniref:hypothetical protein n=1 Tax=Leisingera sp. M658 TaxID=2867015 RepID=UPI0021A49E25|nr:hypothetical protein [Leisingera sp. M658]UWQ77371.1 hypothetical protein K3724_22815 [Leisingera sp. M658]